ncbi:glycosyltransferase family 2 protein [Maricaulaceae bacterium MS644]
MTLTVLIPTFRRPDSLARAMKSVFAQDRTPDEIVIADNDPGGSARPVVDSLRAGAPCPLVYVHAREPGVANARNEGFAAASGSRIAQLDDDESAPSRWLSALEAVRETTGAHVVFGPVRPEADPGHASAFAAAWIRRLYAREPDLAEGVTKKPWGCGNSLIDRAAANLPDPVFDPRANETGGEDDLLFAHMARTGAVFAWAGAAGVIEHVEDDRLKLVHLARRALAFGQGPSQTAAHEGRPLAVAGWMMVGAAQMLACGALAAPAALLSPATCAALADKAVQGAGKLVWFDFAAPRFYGRARLS